MAERRLLILGGTAEAAELARRAAGVPGLRVVTSLAGRTRDPAPLPGEVRVGGFGGAEGLAAWLVRERIAAVVDATHPFAARISANAAEACARAGVPRLMLVRPAWEPVPGDRWIEVADLDAAAAALPDVPGTVFLAVGRLELAAFAGRADRTFLVRTVDPPGGPLPVPNARLVLGRGPFAVADEVRLFAEHGIGAVVSKNSGGTGSHAKIAAARAAGIPVVMVRRPALPPGEAVADAAAALAWVGGIGCRRP